MKKFLVLLMFACVVSFAVSAQESASVKKATPVTTIKPLEAEKGDKGSDKTTKACCKGKSAKECSKGKGSKSCSSTANASAEGTKPACCAAKEGKPGCHGAKVEKAEEAKPTK